MNGFALNRPNLSNVEPKLGETVPSKAITPQLTYCSDAVIPLLDFVATST